MEIFGSGYVFIIGLIEGGILFLIGIFGFLIIIDLEVYGYCCDVFLCVWYYELWFLDICFCYSSRWEGEFFILFFVRMYFGFIYIIL